MQVWAWKQRTFVWLSGQTFGETINESEAVEGVSGSCVRFDFHLYGGRRGTTFVRMQSKNSRTKKTIRKETSPEEVLLTYLNAKLRTGWIGVSEETYALLTEKDRRAMTKEEYLSVAANRNPFISQEIQTAILKKTSYSVKSGSIQEGVAEIRVQMSSPVTPALYRDLIEYKKTPQKESRLLEYINSPEVQMQQDELLYTLHNEKEGWRVFLDLERENHIKTLLAEAEKLAPSFEMLGPVDGLVLESMKENLLLAREKYQRVLELDNKRFIAKNNLKYLLKKIKKLNFYEKYKENVSIKNVHIGSDTFGGTGVFGEIKNRGDVALKTVGLIIYFLDDQDNPVHEMSYIPVYVTKRSYGEDAVPLKPNYSRKFGVRTDSAPSEWSKKVRIILSDLEAQP